MAIFGGFLAYKGLIWHVVHKMCNYNIIFRKLDIFLAKMISISTCYTSGRGTIKISCVWPLHYLRLVRVPCCAHVVALSCTDSSNIFVTTTTINR